MILGNLNKLLFFHLTVKIFVGKSGKGVNFSVVFSAGFFGAIGRSFVFRGRRDYFNIVKICIFFIL